MQLVSVLIVENDQIQSSNLKQGLERLEYQVVGVANTGELALEIAEQTKPDLVVMDIELDGPIDGIETANRIHDLYGTPIIYLSQFDDVRTYRSARRNIRAEYVTKPLSIVNVLNAIDNLLLKPNEHDKEPLPKINDRIFVKHGSRHSAIFIEDITYIEANREVTIIHHTTSDKPATVGVNLGTLETKLKDFHFLARCSRYHMVNLNKVTQIKDQMMPSPTTGKELLKKVIIVADQTVIVSDSYKSKITSRFHLH